MTVLAFLFTNMLYLSTSAKLSPITMKPKPNRHWSTTSEHCLRPNLKNPKNGDHSPGPKRLIKVIILLIFTRLNHKRIFKDSPDRFVRFETTIWCHHIYWRRLERMKIRKKQFTKVVTTLINAIFWAPYKVMVLWNIFRIRLKRRIYRKIYFKLHTWTLMGLYKIGLFRMSLYSKIIFWNFAREWKEEAIIWT